MYISKIEIENFRCFGENDKQLSLSLQDGLTALVGENDSGKTAIIDAIRITLGSRDQEYYRVDDHDFHWPVGASERSKEIRIRCRFDGLTTHDKGAFAEYLTYESDGAHNKAILYVNWTAKDAAGLRGSRRFVQVEVKSGQASDGPALDAEARSLLRATYLRPLRDAERALAAGRGSRLSQILQHTKEVRDSGTPYDTSANPSPDPKTLSVLGVGDFTSALLKDHNGIKKARERLNENFLAPLSFSGSDLVGHIGVSVSGDDDIRLRQLLEKLELELRDDSGRGPANRGLGSNNILFMACELLLLGSDAADFPLLLIEEPEAHLHPQRQLRLMQFLQDQVNVERQDGQSIQIIVSTHSPTLASAIKLDSLAIIQGGKAFSLSSGETLLQKSDYRFLERFLDSTKANLFFARGVAIVEGDGENILLPTLARLIGFDFAAHGVSVVNVGHVGLRRFARIFQRSNAPNDGTINVPVSCIADLDVMPDCAATITGYVKAGDEWPAKNARRWRAKTDFTAPELETYRNAIRSKADGQQVKTFVSDEWTFEYDLAFAGLAEDVWIAASLAREDDNINSGSKTQTSVEAAAQQTYAALQPENLQPDTLASTVYALFTTGTKASKAIAAQYLAERLEKKISETSLTKETLKSKVPQYLISAIAHACGRSEAEEAAIPPESEAE